MAKIEETTPEGRAQSAMAQLEPVLTEAEGAVTDVMQAASPVGTFSGKRQKALATLINKINKEMDVGFELETNFSDVKNGPLPDQLTRGLLAIKQTVDSFAATMPEEVTMQPFEVSQITDDGILARVTAEIDQLFKNKEFRKFLREEQPTVDVVEEAPTAEQEAPIETAMAGSAPPPVEEGSELDILLNQVGA